MNTQAVIFDMDGVLIDSEPFWRKAEQEVFSDLGLSLTDNQCRSTAGLRITEVVDLWYNRHPWPGYDNAKTTGVIVDRVIQLVLSEGTALPGVHYALDVCVKNNLKIALATSSPQALMDAVLTRLGLTQQFVVRQCADHIKYAKPHPEIFLITAGKLMVNPLHCAVIEDTLNGMIAAKSARMYTVVVPESHQAADSRFSLADVQLNSLLDFNIGVLQ
jgi:sugar-phosphatase